MNWEPEYGFCAMNESDIVGMAKTLEAIRRRLCAYGGASKKCDCKYGLTITDDEPTYEDLGIRSTNRRTGELINSPFFEQTGCPELRELIHRLLHRDVPLV